MITTSTWISMLEKILTNGKTRTCRGKSNIELIANASNWQMITPVILSKKRKLGYRFMVAEALWILSGSSRLSLLRPHSKMIHLFSDDNALMFGAYGPAINMQLPYIVRTLAEDPYSRQAVLTIWRQSPMKSKDIPCTISMQFLLRDDQLHTIATMRSSDAWLGIPYDVFSFSMVSLGVLNLLQQVYPNGPFNVVQLGTLTIAAGSQHIYEENVQAAEDIVLDKQREEFDDSMIDVDNLFLSTSYDDLIDRLQQELVTHE